MKYFPLSLSILLLSSSGAVAQEAPKAPPPGMEAPAEPQVKLKGKALKEKEAQIEVLQGIPKTPYKKLGPLWASKGNMEHTMKDIRKQAAKMGADAVVNLHVRTQKLQSTTYDPGWYGGVGPYGGWWGGMSYWGGYAQSHTYTQPLVTGWAIKWLGAPPSVPQEQMPPKTLEQEVEDAPQN